MKVAGCRCQHNGCSEDFQNSHRYYGVESIFSKVKEMAFAAFLKMNSTTDIYSESCKTLF